MRAFPDPSKGAVMSDKPTYLGLLNAVALAESRAHTYLCAWADVTPSADVRRVLLTVAAREGEHGMSFAKRINELGYELRRKETDEADNAIEIVTSKRSDLEKMKALKLHRLDTGDEPDIFDGFFADHSIDIRTGELLGRYIAEERDSARLLRDCYEQLKAAARDNGASSEADDDRLSRLETKVDAICAAVEEMRATLTASTSTSRSNARAR
jgi:rubrerythrin